MIVPSGALDRITPVVRGKKPWSSRYTSASSALQLLGDTLQADAIAGPRVPPEPGIALPCGRGRRILFEQDYQVLLDLVGDHVLPAQASCWMRCHGTPMTSVRRRSASPFLRTTLTARSRTSGVSRDMAPGSQVALVLQPADHLRHRRCCVAHRLGQPGADDLHGLLLELPDGGEVLLDGRAVAVLHASKSYRPPSQLGAGSCRWGRPGCIGTQVPGGRYPSPSGVAVGPGYSLTCWARQWASRSGRSARVGSPPSRRAPAHRRGWTRAARGCRCWPRGGRTGVMVRSSARVRPFSSAALGLGGAQALRVRRGPASHNRHVCIGQYV